MTGTPWSPRNGYHAYLTGIKIIITQRTWREYLPPRGVGVEEHGQPAIGSPGHDGGHGRVGDIKVLGAGV